MSGLFEKLLNKVLEPICVANPDGVIVFANNSFAELCFEEVDALIGTELGRIINTKNYIEDGFIDLRTAAGWHRQAYLRQVLDMDGGLRAFFFENQTNAFLLPHLKEVKKIALVAEKTDNAVVITDADGYIEWVNNGFTKITGYVLEEVYGKKPGAVLQGPETSPKAIQNMREKIAQKVPFHEEVLNYTKSGQPYWLRLYIAPVFDEQGNHVKFIAIETDITQEIKTREELYNLSLVAHHTTDAVAITDRMGHILWANDKTYSLMGISKDDEKSLHICQLLCSGSKQSDEHIKELIEKGANFMLCMSVSGIQLEVKGTLVNDHQGNLNRYIFVFTNKSTKQSVLADYEEATLWLQQYE